MKGNSRFIKHKKIGYEEDNLLEFYRNEFNASKMQREDCIEAKSCIPSVALALRFQLWSICCKNQLMLAISLKGKHKIALKHYKQLLNLSRG